MAERSGVVCGGSWCVDRNIVLDGWPAEETVATILQSSDHGGCPSHNMATALRRLGGTFPIEGIGLIGDDAEGKLLQRICRELSIGQHQLHVQPNLTTPVSLVMIDSKTGKRTFFYSPGAHKLLTPDHFDFTGSTAKIGHFGLPGLHDQMDAPWKSDASGWVAVLKAARAAGMKTNVELVTIEPARIRAAAEPMLPYLDMLVINDFEAGAVAGLDTVRKGVTDVAACRAAAAHILERSIAGLIAVHFPLGGIVLTRDGRTYEHPSVAVPQDAIKSSNGAGDAFASGILFGVHEGWTPDRALTLANATAAASLRHDSTTGAIVPWQECLALAEKWGWRPGFN